jgi:NADPH-dependent 2,4-dienoyl-CoA reductase/sulfur reductase-like enzyme/rhodanese-related sulfurtransferase
MTGKIVIIGGVATGPKAAARAKRRDQGAEITVIERGRLLSYAGCGMPFLIEGSIDDIRELLCTSRGVMRDEAYFESVKGVKVLARNEAVSIKREEKTVKVRDLETDRLYDIPYDKLVLAVGASPIIPRMEGIDLNGVYRLYSPSDAKAIRGDLDFGVGKVVIIGGGLIGMEVCGAFDAHGCDVTVIEAMDQLLPHLLDPDMALLLERHIRRRGVDVRTGSKVVELRDGGSGHVSKVVTADGSEFEAEMVIVAIGVRPNVDLAKAAGLGIGETGAIAVNDRLQTSDPDIYAGGDCVENTCLITGRKVYVPLGSTANKHGRVIGDNVTGGYTTFPGVASTTVFKILDYNVGKTGLNSAQALDMGYDIVTAIAPKDDCSHYYPGAKPFIIKLIGERGSGRLLGAQVLGFGEGIKRIDVVASSLYHGATVKDVADLDLGYAPPFSTAIDPVAHAANIIRNKMEGLAHGISSKDLKDKIDAGDDFVLLDVRYREEVKKRPFNDPRVINIPNPELRERLDELPLEGEIIVFCRTSVRAYEAERVLSSKGFKDVKFLDGSLHAWPYSL